MFKQILNIIQMLLNIILLNKSDTNKTEAEIQQKKKDLADKFKNDIKQSHETNNLDEIRKNLGD